MSTGYKVNGVDISNYLQLYFTGSEESVLAGFKINGLQAFARRDNDPNNAPTISTGYKINGVDISQYANKTNPSLTVELSGSTTYDGQPHQASIVKISPTDSWISVATSTQTNANTYNENDYTYTPSPGYVLTVAPSGFTINPRVLSLIANGSQSFTYSGNSNQFTAYTILNAVSQDTNYLVSNTTKTSAGTYTATLTTASSNYSISTTNYELSWTVSAKTISLTANGSSSFSYTGNSITFSGYTISGTVAADSGYSVGGRTSTNCGSYTASLTASSSNYIVSPTSYQVSWYVTPTTPANFTASVANYVTMSLSWSAVGGCTYNIYYWNGSSYAFLTNTSSTSYSLGNGATQTTYYYYVEATASSGTSVRTAIAGITTGSDGYYYNVPYDSGWVDQRPLCLTGSRDGTIGLKAWVQGTYGITISQVGVERAQCNFSTSLLWGTATRFIRWNLNGTTVNFPRSTDTSAPNPWNSTTTGLAPYYRSTVTTGTITYTLVATGSGWSTNNTAGVSGVNWVYANWKNAGTAVAYANPVNPSITYY